MNPFSIQKRNGIPALFKDGEIFPPVFFWSSDVNEEDFPAFRECGIRLFSCFRSTPYYENPYWIGENEYDFSYYDHFLNKFHELVPDGYIIPRIFVAAPYWWLEKHPEEVVAFPDNPPYQRGISGTFHESFASELWKKEQGEALRKLLRHFKSSPYGKQIMAIHIASGTCGEWHYWGADHHPDCSPAMEKRFGKPIPPPEERGTDYYHCFYTAAVDAIDHFAKIVKEETDYLTAVFYGYIPESCNLYGAHCAMDEFLNLKSIDIVSAPHTYKDRAGGGAAYFRAYPASLAEHGKLFLDESDDRTTLGKRHYMGKFRIKAETEAEAVGMIRREFGNAVTHCCGQWFMDIDGDMFRSQIYKDAIQNLVNAYGRLFQYQLERNSEIAVISDPASSYCYSRYQYPFAYMFELCTIKNLMKAGAPFDLFCVCDIEYEKMKKYKIIILNDCSALSPEKRVELKKLQCDGRTFLWNGIPGAIDRTGKMSFTEAMKDLTKINFTGTDRMDLQVYTEQYEWENQRFSPGFFPQNADFKFSDWRSVYRTISDFSASELRNLYRENGIHIFSETDDVFSANSHLIMLHASTDGIKKIMLPEPKKMIDPDSGNIIGENMKEFTFTLSKGDTALFELM